MCYPQAKPLARACRERSIANVGHRTDCRAAAVESVVINLATRMTDMSANDKYSATPSQSFRTRSAGKVPAYMGGHSAMNQNSTDVARTPAANQAGPDDIDEQIRLFFARNPTQTPIAGRRDK